MVKDNSRRLSLRPIFIATLWAAASWLFFRVARSTRINADMGASLAPSKTANRPVATSLLYARRCSSRTARRPSLPSKAIPTNSGQVNRLGFFSVFYGMQSGTLRLHSCLMPLTRSATGTQYARRRSGRFRTTRWSVELFSAEVAAEERFVLVLE